MKTFFRTTIIWFTLIAWFGLYIKRFNNNRAAYVANFFVSNTTIQTDNAETQTIEDKLETIIQLLQGQTTADQSPSLLPTATAPTTVNLYYFNELQDSALPIEQQINTSSILPVQRTIRSSQNLIADTIKALLQWNLSEQEKNAWFITEFPNAQFRLLDTQLDSQGTLTLTFNEVPWFTTWWSARMLILSKSIEKTALQFPQVTRVVFQPETLFQP